MSERESFISATTVGAAIGLLAAVSVAASVCFDWGFLHALEIDFGDVPSTIADHTRSALLWVPAAAVAVLTNFIYRLTAGRIEQGRTEEEILASSPYPRLLRLIRAGPNVLTYGVLFYFIVMFILFGGQLLAFALVGAAFFWVIFLNWAFAHPRVFDQYHRYLKVTLLLIPPIGMVLFALGFNEGIRRVQYGAPTAIYRADDSEPKLIVLLRFYEAGVLYSTEDRIVFEPWGAIERVDVSPRAQVRQGLVCEWFGQCYADSNPLQRRAGPQ